MVLPVWLVPALIAGSTAVSFMGSMNQSANLRRAAKTDKNITSCKWNTVRYRIKFVANS